MNATGQTFNIALTGTLSFNASHHDPLPKLSEGTPKPTVSLDFNDGAWTYLELNNESVHFWSVEHEGTLNSWHNERESNEVDGTGPWESILSMEQIEEILEWGSKVHERIDCYTYGIMLEATRGNVQALMLAIATETMDAIPSIPGVTVSADS